MTQKGSALSGAATTEEVLESSAHITMLGRHGGMKGLQQFFTPREAAELAAYVTGSGRRPEVAVFDPTAGDGSFLAGVDPAYAFGVEIDKDQIESAEGSYKAIQGDIKKVWPLIERICPEFGAVWSNPPFGLKDWSDPTVNGGKPIGSARLAFIYASRILAADGQLIFICGRDQFHREIADLPEAAGIYYVVECDDLYAEQDVEHPCAIAFGVHPDMRNSVYDVTTRAYSKTEGFKTKSLSRDSLDIIGPAILEERQATIGQYQRVADRLYNVRMYTEAWEAIDKEFTRRKRVEDGKKVKREFDVELVGGKTLQVLPSNFSTIALGKHNYLSAIRGLHAKNLNYFGTYERDWKTLMEAKEKGLLSVDPRVIDAVEDLLHISRRATCPRYPIKETQRLGYLSDLNLIRCKKDDPERGFHAGQDYQIVTRTVDQRVKVQRLVTIKRGKNAGDTELRDFEQNRKALRVTIEGKHNFYDSLDHQEDIKYLIEHFEMPDPGDVGTRYPEEVAANRALLNEIQEEVIGPNSKAYHAKHKDKPPITLKTFQVEDIARGMVDDSIVLAWEQGLGKTVGGLTYIEAQFRRGAQKAALIICPQDLIPQWVAECERVLGVKPTVLKGHGMAKGLAKKLRQGGEGIYITYYEALAVTGTSKSEMLPEVIVETKTEMVKWPGTDRYGPAVYCYMNDDLAWQAVSTAQVEAESEEWHRARWMPERTTDYVEPSDGGSAHQSSYTYIPAWWQEKAKNLTSKDLCPNCKADRQTGWNGKFCRAEGQDGSVCGYSHYLHRVKPMGSLLSTAFRHGVVIVDEGTMIQGDYSIRSMTVRGLSARNKLLLTGTPVKNYIPQAFWLLWWCLGNASKRFPYDYGGKTSFENNHAVIEYGIAGGKKTTRKVLPEVTNLSQLWRLLASSIIRRRKEESGEKLVPKTIHPITVPLGEAQREQMEAWRENFPLFFEEKYPDAPVVKSGAHVLMAPMLGLGQKLDYAATIPEGDPDYEWPGVEGVSNFTPANLRVLQITMALVKQGRKVLVGSQWIATAKWLAEQLEEKGVVSGHLLDANGNTAPPAKRAKMVGQFQSGPIQALCVGIQAVRLGHNLDAASAAVVSGLPWDFESFDQFIARVHRMTSLKPVDVFVVIPGSNPDKEKGTITRRKFDILRQKGDAASLALDGRLIEQEENPVSEDEVVRQMIEQGIPLVGDEMPEADIERLWSEVPHIDQYEPPAELLQATEEAIVDDGESKVTFELPAGEPYTVQTAEEAGYQPDFQPHMLIEAARADEADVDAQAAGEPPEFEAPVDVLATLEASVDVEPIFSLQFAGGEQTEEPEETPKQPEVLHTTEAPMNPTQITAAIRELKALHDEGILTDLEYQKGKDGLIKQLIPDNTQLSLTGTED